MATGIVTDPIFKQHLTGEGHPERPERLDALLSALERDGLMKKVAAVEPRVATEDEIALCHTRDYIATVKRDVGRGAHDLSTGDTAISSKSLDVALRAVGGLLNAVDAVTSGRMDAVFCASRPPGHHATPNRGMGFCIFNNVAIAARYAQRKHGASRVLIADWDVHHGNGTQDAFYTDPSVLFFSTHQYPWYPGTGADDETGEGAGKGFTINCPLPAGSGAKEIVGAFREKLVPKAHDFSPDLVILSAGFDSRAGDPLGRFTLTDEDFADLTAIMLEIGKGKLVSALEGGYNLSGLGSAAAAHVKALS
jgi:acetoin utilization deacetylase AcuC-like enzyme